MKNKESNFEEYGKKVWIWEQATSPLEVHEFLCLCDKNAPGNTPKRKLETFSKHVANDAVTLLRLENTLVATFTLSIAAPNGLVLDNFPAQNKPMYLQRLAVHPDWVASNSLVGTRCVRQAIRMARGHHADSLRAEVASHIPLVHKLLLTLGFIQYGPSRKTSKGEYLSMQLTLPSNENITYAFNC